MAKIPIGETKQKMGSECRQQWERERARCEERERAHTELNRCVFPSAMVRPGTKTFFFSLLLLKIRHLVSLPFDFVCVLKSWTERKGKDYNHFSPSFFFSSPSSHIWFWRGEKTIALMQLVHIFRTLACNAHEHTCCKCANGGLCRWYNQLSKACWVFSTLWRPLGPYGLKVYYWKK